MLSDEEVTEMSVDASFMAFNLHTGACATSDSKMILLWRQGWCSMHRTWHVCHVEQLHLPLRFCVFDVVHAMAGA